MQMLRYLGARYPDQIIYVGLVLSAMTSIWFVVEIARLLIGWL